LRGGKAKAISWPAVTSRNTLPLERLLTDDPYENGCTLSDVTMAALPGIDTTAPKMTKPAWHTANRKRHPFIGHGSGAQA
jgi:hypothetical protein